MSKTWKPLQRAVMPAAHTIDEPVIVQFAQRIGVSPAEAVRIANEEDAKTEVWINDLYQVQVRHLEPDEGSDSPPWVHLNIRRRDGGPILRDWRHFQQIKNELVGRECEGFEMYPAETRKVDTSNKYHLFVCTDPGFRLPFGWKERDVTYDDGYSNGTRQRRLEPRLATLEVP